MNAKIPNLNAKIPNLNAKSPNLNAKPCNSHSVWRWVLRIDPKMRTNTLLLEPKTSNFYSSLSSKFFYCFVVKFYVLELILICSFYLYVGAMVFWWLTAKIVRLSYHCRCTYWNIAQFVDFTCDFRRWSRLLINVMYLSSAIVVFLEETLALFIFYTRLTGIFWRCSKQFDVHLQSS